MQTSHERFHDDKKEEGKVGLGGGTSGAKCMRMRDGIRTAHAARSRTRAVIVWITLLQDGKHGRKSLSKDVAYWIQKLRGDPAITSLSGSMCPSLPLPRRKTTESPEDSPLERTLGLHIRQAHTPPTIAVRTLFASLRLILPASSRPAQSRTAPDRGACPARDADGAQNSRIRVGGCAGTCPS